MDPMTIGALMQMVGGQQESPIGMLANTVFGGIFQGSQSRNLRPNFPYGGAMGRVEKDEVVQTPDGQMAEIGGGTHESGNDTLISAPEGTEVFSDRIEIDGESMAERKKKREARMKKLESEMDSVTESMEDRGVDGIGRQSDQRRFELLMADYLKEKMQDEADMAAQEAISAGEQEPQEFKSGGKMKYAYGGKKDYAMGGTFGIPDLEELMTSTPHDRYATTGRSPERRAATQPLAPRHPVGTDPQITGDRSDNILAATQRAAGRVSPDTETFQPKPQTGDGMNPWSRAGSMINMFAPTAITLAQRLGDRPNPNYFEGFGDEGLRTQGQSFRAAAGTRDRQLSDVGRAEAAQRMRNRSAARGVGTHRALGLATASQAGQQRQEIRSNYAERISNLFRERAQMQNQRDQVVMGGAREADIADRQDRAAFHTNLARSMTQGATSAQHYGLMKDRLAQASAAELAQMMQMLNVGSMIPQTGQ